MCQVQGSNNTPTLEETEILSSVLYFTSGSTEKQLRYTNTHITSIEIKNKAEEIELNKACHLAFHGSQIVVSCEQ